MAEVTRPRTPERWVPVVEPGFEDLYLVSSRGRVWSRPRQTVRGVMGGNMLALTPHAKGYRTVVLSGHGHKRQVLVHVIELEAFAGKCPPGKQARHLDGKPWNNLWPENLIWGTQIENEADKKDHGTDSAGERNAMAKLTPDQVREIRRRGAVENQIAVGREFGIAQPQVSRIVTRQRWGHIEDLEAL